MQKKVAALLCIGMVVLFIVGCQSQTPKSSSPSTNPPSSQQSSDADDSMEMDEVSEVPEDDDAQKIDELEVDKFDY